MKQPIKNLLKSASKKISGIFIDPYTSLWGRQKPPLGKRILKTAAYRLASKGIYLNENEKRFAALKNKYKGERCFIIGNGPSLNQLDLRKLVNEYTFGVNAIYLNYENMGFYPTFYVLEDYLVAEDRASEINEYKGSEYKFWGNYLDYVIKKDEKSIVTNVIMDYTEPFEPYFSKDAVRSIGVGGSVTFMCLQLAYFMGFEKVYMIGFDHNYNIPKDAEVNSVVITSQSDDVNHFAPGYFGKGYRWHDPRVDRMTQGFEASKNAFEADGRKVYNATAGGHLEVFDRIDYNTLF